MIGLLKFHVFFRISTRNAPAIIEEQASKKHYLTSCLIEYRYINEYSLDIQKYNELFEDLYKVYDGDLLYKAVRFMQLCIKSIYSNR